jgi:hypothetical protein
MRRYWLLVVPLLLAMLPPPVTASETKTETTESSCRLSDGVQHVIYVQFDNTHFTRDNPNVPSDLEQMPHLLNFIKDNGALLTNHHTPLIAHTATDILTSLTGLYGDKMGIPISNSFRYYLSDGSGKTNGSSSFVYWTDPLNDPSRVNPGPVMIGANGQIAPAPWVPYTRAGCNVGSVSVANTALENTGADITTVFGLGSPEYLEAQDPKGNAFGDFVGIAVHCGKGAGLCNPTDHARPDLLPSEPGGYSGFQALFGHKYVSQGIGAITSTSGAAITQFPGFDGMTADQSLGYTAAMQEHGVPVTFAYVSDAHAGHGVLTRPFGPGEQPYVDQLKAYDQAFKSFFDGLAAHGITRHNTLFVFTADEGDHLIAGPPSPASCDGIHVACTYDPKRIGEVSGNLTGLVATQTTATTAFTVHADSAPNVYVTGNPTSSSPTARDLERGAGTITATNPYTLKLEKVDNFLADPSEMKLLHMLTADPVRNPTFTMFAKPDYFLFAGAPNCTGGCINIDNGFNWNHGDVAPEINTTWLGIAGPGINEERGIVNDVWTDHADIRPTMLFLAGLKDDYQSQGRVITELFNSEDLPSSLRNHYETLLELGTVYKQLNAPVGKLGLDSLSFATEAIASGSVADDSRYTAAAARIAGWTARRDSLAASIASALDGAEFHHRAINQNRAERLIDQANALIAEVHQAV